jgi:hypothetical protein
MSITPGGKEGGDTDWREEELEVSSSDEFRITSSCVFE